VISRYLAMATDQPCLVLGRMCTTGTDGTNSSTSTRRRHRGAAQHSKRPSGWLKSIKAAAEQSDRRWDPKLGWIDYIEPNDQEEKEVQFFTL